MKKEELFTAIRKDGCDEDPGVIKIAEKIWAFVSLREDDTYDGVLVMLQGKLKRASGNETSKVLESWMSRL